MEIRKKANYVMINVNGMDLVIGRDEFDKQLLDSKDKDFLSFDTRDIYMVQMGQAPNGQIGVGAKALAEAHPWQYHTLYINRNALVYYELNEDSPAVKAVTHERTGLVTATNIQGIQ